MSWKFRRRALLIFGLAALAVTGFSQTYTESKKITRSFPTNPDTRLDVSNKYGMIHLIPWKKDSVEITVDLFVQSNSTKKLERIMSNIDFEFTGTKYYIIASTNLGNKYSAFFSDLKDLSENLLPSQNQVEIDYTVRLPSGTGVNVSNKFGDIFIDDLKGDVTVSLSNGDLKVNRLEGEATINHHFGNGVINYVNNARLSLSYSDFEIRKAQQISITSKSSEIRLDDVKILKTESRRDKYTIGTVDNLFGDSYFTEIRITNMEEEVNYIPRYGNLNIDSVGTGFSYINLNSEYADLRLAFKRSSSFYIEVDHHPDVVLKMPGYFGEMKWTDLEPNQVRLAGNVGTAGSSRRVEITAPYKCNIIIEAH